jgi:hypothetical protein
MIYGYAQVSTDGQSIEAQVRQIRAAGYARECSAKPPAALEPTGRSFAGCLAEIGPGDVVIVTRLDRLARSTRDLLNTLAAITGKKAGFRSLADAWPTPPRRTAVCCSPFSAASLSSSAIVSAPAPLRAAAGQVEFTATEGADTPRLRSQVRLRVW